LVAPFDGDTGLIDMSARAGFDSSWNLRIANPDIPRRQDRARPKKGSPP
jgi:hypothetical protein